MKTRPTVYDVAAHAGVSIATVSRVLRRPDDVREATRILVLDSVRALGYVPSASARGLAGRRTGVVGLLLPGFDEAVERLDTASIQLGLTPVIDDRVERHRASGAATLYYDEVVRGAESEAWQRGFALLVAAGTDSTLEMLMDDIAGRVDGLAVVATSIAAELLERIASRVPVVLIADSADDRGLDRVSVANEAGMAALMRAVLENRRVRRVVYVSGPADSPDERDRRAGFDAALRSAPGVAVQVIGGDYSEERGRRVAADLVALERDQPGSLPDAVICSNDQTALGALDAFHRAGVVVPDRVVVTGFDGVDAGRFSIPRLTTVRQPMVDVGRAAMRSLVIRLEHPDAPARSLVLPVEVLLRESCPPSE